MLPIDGKLNDIKYLHEITKNNFVIKWQQMLKEKKKEATLYHYDHRMLSLLTNDLQPDLGRSKSNPYRTRFYKRRPYHKILMEHPISWKKKEDSKEEKGH